MAMQQHCPLTRPGPREPLLDQCGKRQRGAPGRQQQPCNPDGGLLLHTQLPATQLARGGGRTITRAAAALLPSPPPPPHTCTHPNAHPPRAAPVPQVHCAVPAGRGQRAPAMTASTSATLRGTSVRLSAPAAVTTTLSSRRTPPSDMCASTASRTRYCDLAGSWQWRR